MKKIKERMIEELNNAKKIQRELIDTQITADKIGYETVFALETPEKTAQSAYQGGYQLGVQDGYIECLQRMLIMCEEEENGI